MKPKIIAEHYRRHENYWDQKQPEMRQLYLAYMTRYWNKEASIDLTEAENLIETSRAYEFVEGYIASLFARSPSVLVKEDMRGDGNPEIAKAICNKCLPRILKALGQTSRRGIIYDCAFIKLIPTDHPDPIRRVKACSIQCWDVIVDTDAQTWEEISFVGHRSWITVAEAKSRYGNKKFEGSGDKTDYIQDEDPNISYDPNKQHALTDPEFQYIEIVEWYDMKAGKIVVWSPNYANGDKLLFDGIEIEVGMGDTQTIKYNDIPFKDHWGKSICPIVPLYFSEDPDVPMRGYSALRRVYDQVQETNIIRTGQANMIRKTARQWMVDKEMVTEDEMNRLVGGIDGEYIMVTRKQGRSLHDAVVSVPHTPVPHELQNYVQQVQDDFEKGSVLAPFTRGESTRATATEITALASYSSSEIGRLAKERDLMIEEIARVFLSIYKIYIPEEGDSIIINGEPTKVMKKHLDADFEFYANDMGSTPVSEAVKKQEFLSTMPVLGEFGVSPAKLLSHLVQMLDLPNEFLTDLGGDANPNQPLGQPEQNIQSSQGMQGEPSADDVTQFLPGQDGGMI